MTDQMEPVKTSIPEQFLATLWPLFEGSIHMPQIDNFMALPQRPYLPIEVRSNHLSTLEQTNGSKWKTDVDLNEILKIVHLEYIPTRGGKLTWSKNGRM
jgi:ABC-type uncharacterized transport system fused permease/ATPase subunit